MDDKYIFDKREMKKAFKKYGLIFLFAIPVLIGVNYFLNKAIKNIWLVVLIDVVIMFAIILMLVLLRLLVQLNLYLFFLMPYLFLF